MTASSATRRASDLDVVVSGFDNTYAAGSMSFTFYDRTGNMMGAAITADFTSKFHAFYQGQTAGSSFLMRVTFPVTGSDARIEVFTTRIDTIYGATFVLLAPEHALVDRFANESPDPQAFRDRVAKFRALDRQARRDGSIDKEGFDTGRTALNPFTGKEVPIWVANFVLAEYGTGAIMAVPAHDQRDFEFARKYGLPVRIVVRSSETPPTADELTAANVVSGMGESAGSLIGPLGAAILTPVSWSQTTNLEVFVPSGQNLERFAYTADSDFYRRVIATSAGYDSKKSWRVGGGLTYQSPNGVWQVAFGYARGINAIRSHGRGADTIGVALQFDLDRDMKQGGLFDPAKLRDRLRGLEGLFRR